MNILIVSQYFYPENFRINDVAKALTERGHNVTVYTGLPNYGKSGFFKGYNLFGPYKEEVDDYKIIRVPLFPRGDNKGMRLILNYISFAFFASLLAPFLLRKKYDKILVNQLSPVFVAFPAIVMKKVFRIPIYHWVADLWPESLMATNTIQSPKVIAFVGKIVKFIYKNCDLILITSKGFASSIKSYGVAEEKIVYWPQWGEELFLQEEKDLIQVDDFPSEGLKICFAGNIGSAQSFEAIVQAAYLLKAQKEIHWIILGSGNMKDWVEKEVHSLGVSDNFHLIGRRPIEMMPSYFSKMDALLVSLKEDPLFDITVPGKVQAYLASAKPIIASLNGEGADIVNEAKAGFSAKAGNAQELADAVMKLYKLTSEEREEMGRNGRNFFLKHFQREKLLSKLENYMS